MTNMLENRTAVIYGAGGSIGGAVARAFVASDLARSMTSATVNVSCGAIVDI
jgi:NAD(P)-dependent dehydrogenase (short-subunit alcohol dehydrogenase family)